MPTPVSNNLPPVPTPTLAAPPRVAATVGQQPFDSLFASLISSLTPVEATATSTVPVAAGDGTRPTDNASSASSILAAGLLVAPATPQPAPIFVPVATTTTPTPSPIPVAVTSVTSNPVTIELPTTPNATPATVPFIATPVPRFPAQTPLVAELLPRDTSTSVAAPDSVGAAESVGALPNATAGPRASLVARLPNPVESGQSAGAVRLATAEASTAQNDFRVALAISERAAIADRTDGSNVAPVIAESVPPASAPAVQSAAPATVPTAPVAAQIADQLIPHVRAARDGPFEVKLRLDPVELGEVRVHLQVGADGIRGTIVAANEAARFLIEQQLPELRQRFDSMGLTMGSMDVSTRTGSGEGKSPQRPPLDEPATPARRIATSTATSAVRSDRTSTLDVRV